MEFDPYDFVPVVSSWLETSGEYIGSGTAELSNPKGTVRGPASAHFDQQGKVLVELDVQEYETEGPLEGGLLQLITGAAPVQVDGRTRLYGNGTAKNKIVDFIMDTPEGQFRIIGETNYQMSLTIGTGAAEPPIRLKLSPLRSQFDRIGARDPKYWVLPLSNYVSDFNTLHPAFDDHPLRIYRTPPIPDALPSEQKQLARVYANSMNSLIIFQFDGLPGFIERLPDYRELRNQLESRQASNLLTAVMVGEVGSNSIDDWDSWFPQNVLRLLGVASGSEVGAPWVEFRDVDGGPVRRLHRGLGAPSFARGHPAMEEIRIDDPEKEGTGYLLTKASVSPVFQASEVGFVMRAITQGGRYDSTTVETRLSHLFRGFENLLKYYGLRTQNLMQALDPNQRQRVTDELRDAEQAIRAISTEPAVTQDQRRNLERIASRVQNAANTDKDVGLGVAELLKLPSINLPDFDALDTHLANNPHPHGNTLSQILTKQRNIIVHEGYFDFLSGAYKIDDVIEVLQHAHDILVRALLRMLDYDGTYQPTMMVGPVLVPLTWVTSTTSADKLGYS